MKLYYAPGACSLSDHIALREASIPFTTERVDLKTKTTASGEDFYSINAKGYVPALMLDDGEILTENIAVLDYIASVAPTLGLAGPLGRTRLLESLAYISTELHKSFKPFFAGASESDKARASAYIGKRMEYLAANIRGDYLFGDRPTVADFYLFVMMQWADRFAVPIPSAFQALRARLLARPAVQDALKAEG